MNQKRVYLVTALALTVAFIVALAIVNTLRPNKAFLDLHPKFRSWPDQFISELSAADKLSRSTGSEIEGYSRLAKLYHANGFFPEAIDCYEKLSSLDSKNAKWPHLQAHILAGYGQIDKALPLLEKASKLSLKNPATSLRLGDLYFKSNQTDKAKAVYTDVLRNDPDNVYALLGLARSDVKQGNWISARGRLIRSLELDNSFYGGWSLLTTVFEHLGETELASKTRLRSEASGRYKDSPDPWLPNLNESCYNAYQLSIAAATAATPEEAIQLLQRAISFGSATSNYHRQLGKVYLKKNQDSLAMQEFVTATRLSPNNAEAWAARVDLLMKRQEFEQLPEVLDKAIDLCPNSAYLHFANGILHASLNNSHKAAEEFIKAKQLQPNEARSYIQLSRLYVSEGRYTDAKREIEMAYAAEPGNAAIIVMLARLSILTNQKPESEKWIEKLKIMPSRDNKEISLLIRQFQAAFREGKSEHQPDIGH